MNKILRDSVPSEFFREFMDTRAAKFLDIPITKEVEGHKRRWPGKEKFVFFWWILANGYAVGWNENPSRGWSFPVVKLIFNA